MRQQTLWHTITHSELRSEELASSSAERLVIEAHYSLISTGTERLVITESICPETASKMRVPYMQGDFSDSFTYGYSLTGQVISGPPQWVGKHVHLLHPHQRYAIVAAEDVIEIPPEIDLIKATLISNMETVVNAVWDAQVSIGDRIAVLGYGIIGTLLCGLLKTIPGIELWVIEANAQRRSDAANAGFNILSSTEELPSAVDIAFNTTCNSRGLQSAINCTGMEGLVVELSWYGDRNCEINLGGSFHYERKRLLSSQVSSIPGHKRKRWDHRERKALVLRLLENIDTNNMITRQVAFAASAEFFNSIRQQPPTERGIIFNYLG